MNHRVFLLVEQKSVICSKVLLTRKTDHLILNTAGLKFTVGRVMARLRKYQNGVIILGENFLLLLYSVFFGWSCPAERNVKKVNNYFFITGDDAKLWIIIGALAGGAIVLVVIVVVAWCVHHKRKCRRKGSKGGYSFLEIIESKCSCDK